MEWAFELLELAALYSLGLPSYVSSSYSWQSVRWSATTFQDLIVKSDVDGKQNKILWLFCNCLIRSSRPHSLLPFTLGSCMKRLCNSPGQRVCGQWPSEYSLLADAHCNILYALDTNLSRCRRLTALENQADGVAGSHYRPSDCARYAPSGTPSG